ncbi:MAG: hypothetical protein FJX11_18290, partial [Alphaproteobacteria bacterium]|nr:hypothetical protein [Alphaproteobacteria bacterium]
MALDVYVGSLTRYYAGEWKNVPPEAPRALGRPPQPSRRSVGGGVPTQAELRPTILAWRAGLARSLGNRIETPLDWDEGEQTPYFSGRPGWDGFGSLVLWAAYAEHPAVRLPASLPEEWDHDPVLMRSTATAFRSRYSHLVRNVELWLPGSLSSPSRV